MKKRNNLIIKKFNQNSQFEISNSRDGQSLIEILIALAIGAILIGAATLGIAFMIRSTATNQRLQVASGFARDMIEKLRSWSASDWQNIYLLEKGTSTKYFLIPSSTTFAVVFGEEGMLENDVRVSLVGKWGFDEATGTIAYDAAGSGNNGTLVGTLLRTSSTNCYVGGCLALNGTGYINLDASKIDTAGTKTLSFFFKSNDVTTIKVLFSISPNTSDGITVGTVNSTLVFGASAGSQKTVIGLVTGKWYHVVVVKSSSTVTGVYLDGVSQPLGSTSGWSMINEAKIGSMMGNYMYPGIIDDVRIYNRALSATEIKNLYESKIFSRYFTIQNTCRKKGGTNIIPASSTSCDLDYFEDPSTQQANVFVQWPAASSISELKLVEYITRWRNEVLHEQNWSGGGAQEGPITSPNGKFASSTNIDINSYGIIKVRPE